jgi:hypothetical protein
VLLDNFAGVLLGGVLFFVAAILEENQHVNLPAVLRGAIMVMLGVVNIWLSWMVRGSS